MKPASEDEPVCIHSVLTELKSLGVKVPKIKKLKMSITKQAKSISAASTSSFKIFGVHISEQEQIFVENYFLPKFIVITTEYLKTFTKREIGLFRKAGSVSRQRDLRVKLERGENIDNSEPNDVASLLKQWLRELPEPLIPSYLHDLFVRCLNLQAEKNKMSAILLCCRLLPAEHFYSLKYLLDFLSEIAKNSSMNKMGARNLALVMAPNIFVMGTDSIDKTSNNLLHQHMSIIELLINNAHQLNAMSLCSSHHITEVEASKCNADLDSSNDFLESSPCAKKTKKNGAVQDLFTGIRKLVRQNSLSPNPPRKMQDESKSTEQRSAFKHKAENLDDHLMSPKKKLKTVSNSLPDEVLHFTPNSKKTQSMLGSRDKSNRAHSRKKSFGLLRRKEKKSRPVKDVQADNIQASNLNHMPYPFQEKMEKLQVLLQEPETVAETSPLPSSPLLSPLDIDLLFSKTIFVKKSASDCCLSAQGDFKAKRSFSASSRNCLRLEGSNPSPQNKRTTKRKSDALENANTLSSTIVSYERKNSKLGLNDLDKSSVNTLKVPAKRSNSRKKKNPDHLKNNNFAEDKPTSGRNQSESDIRNVDKGMPSVILSKSLDTDTEKNVPNNDVIVRKGSLTRPEAFTIKPQSFKKNTLSTVKRADSIKISKSKISHSNLPKDNLNLNCQKSKQKDDPFEVISDVKNDGNIVTLNIPDKKRTKRNLRNGSIVRGRPNTVKTGLPSDVCSRYNSESISVNSRHPVVALASSTDSDVLIINNQSENNEHKISITNQLQNITLSTPKEERVIRNADFKVSGNFPSETKVFETAAIVTSERNIFGDTKTDSATVSAKNTIGTISKDADSNAPKITRSVSKRKAQNRLHSDSDSAIHKMKKRSSKISRINSVPEFTTKTKPKSVKKLRDAKSSSIQKSLRKEAKNAAMREKENVCTQESSQNQFDICYSKSPETSVQTTETRVSEREIIKSVEANHEVILNNHNSTTVIGKNNLDHVHNTTAEENNVQSLQNQSDVHPFKTPERNAQTAQIRLTRRNVLESVEANHEVILNKHNSTTVIGKNSLDHVQNTTAEENNVQSSQNQSDVHHFKTPERNAQTAQIRLTRRNVLESVEANHENILNNHESTAVREKENPYQEKIVYHQESSQNQSDFNDFKTPDKNALAPPIWVCGSKFFESGERDQEDSCLDNKRESIAKILKNNRGHVRAKASLYDHKTDSPFITPKMVRNATPCGKFYDSHPQYDSGRKKQSQKRCASLRSNRSTRNSPLPPPPKFHISDSPTTPSHPLKELTNISRSEDVFSPSPAKISVKTPKDNSHSKKPNKKCTLVPKRNSYSGHTPYKLTINRCKVFRSESSPMLPTVVNKSFNETQVGSYANTGELCQYGVEILEALNTNFFQRKKKEIYIT